MADRANSLQRPGVPSSISENKETNANGPDARLSWPAAGRLHDHGNRRPEAGGGRSGAKVGLNQTRRARRSRRASEACVISCGVGSGCASGVSCGRPCGGLYLGVNWPCVLLKGFDKSRARRSYAISTVRRKPYCITHRQINLKGFPERRGAKSLLGAASTLPGSNRSEASAFLRVAEGHTALRVAEGHTAVMLRPVTVVASSGKEIAARHQPRGVSPGCQDPRQEHQPANGGVTIVREGGREGGSRGLCRSFSSGRGPGRLPPTSLRH